MFDLIFGGIDSAKSQEINLLGGFGFFVLVIITVYVLWVYMKKIRTEKSEGTLAEENWDGIGEYKNPLPTGWAAIYAGTIIWTAWYWVIGYPTNGFSQIGQWNEEVQDYKEQFESQWASADKNTLIEMGESVYLAQCAQCHGLQADGMDEKAANLVEYGKAAHVAYVIKNGSKGLGYPGGDMPAGLMSDPNEIKTVSNYVMNGMTGAGADLYNMYCASCHGEDGTGMYGTFPNLKEYGTVEFTEKVLRNGKQGMIGHMPAFEKAGVLSDIQYKAVAEYILSL